MRQPTQKEIEVAKAVMDEMRSYQLHAEGNTTAEIAIGIARAAIRAMLNPDHDMTAAVVDPGNDRTWAVAVYNAMIDAASPQEDGE